MVTAHDRAVAAIDAIVTPLWTPMYVEEPTGDGLFRKVPVAEYLLTAILADPAKVAALLAVLPHESRNDVLGMVRSSVDAIHDDPQLDGAMGLGWTAIHQVLDRLTTTEEQT